MRKADVCSYVRAHPDDDDETMLAVAHPSHNDALFFKGAQRASCFVRNSSPSGLFLRAFPQVARRETAFNRAAVP